MILYPEKKMMFPANPGLEAQKRFENVIDTQRLLEEHHKQLLRDGFFRDKKRFEAENEGK